MKKLISLLAAVCMLGTVGLAAADSTVELDKSVTTGSTTVSLTVDSTADSYTFSIPASVVIDPVTQYGYGTLTLKSGWTLISVNGIKLSISGVTNGIKSSTTSSNGMTETAAQIFSLKDENGDTATYSMMASTLSTKYALSSYSTTATNYYKNALLSAAKGGDNTADQTCDLTFYVKTMPAAGVYTDTITFAITTY